VNPRLALVAFDNQSSSEDQWISSLIGLAGLYQLGNEHALAVNLATDAEGWRTLGVGRTITGNYRREPKGIRVHASLTNTATTELLGDFDELIAEAELLKGSERILGQLLGVKPAPLGSTPAAWAAFAKLSQSSASLSEFLRAHADFAPAYPVFAGFLLREGKRDEAVALKNAIPANADAFSKAQLNLVVAADSKSRLDALRVLTQLRSGDPRMLAELATIASGQGDWALAAEQYRALTRLEPSKVDWWNSLGYAESNQNHLPASVAALNEYRRLAPQEANPIDSLGEVHYQNRQFAAAAKYFDEQSLRFPAFQNGSAWRKASFAYFFAGDLKTADLRFEEWMKRVLSNASPTAQTFQRAMWLARTGRIPDSRALLAKQDPPIHLAMISFGLDGTRPQPSQLQAWNTKITDPALRNEFSLFALLTQPASNLDSLKARITASIPQPQLAQLRNEMLAAAEMTMAEPKQQKPNIFPLPNVIDTPIDATLLRWRLAVIP